MHLRLRTSWNAIQNGAVKVASCSLTLAPRSLFIPPYHPTTSTTASSSSFSLQSPTPSLTEAKRNIRWKKQRKNRIQSSDESSAPLTISAVKELLLSASSSSSATALPPMRMKNPKYAVKQREKDRSTPQHSAPTPTTREMQRGERGGNPIATPPLSSSSGKGASSFFVILSQHMTPEGCFCVLFLPPTRSSPTSSSFSPTNEKRTLILREVRPWRVLRIPTPYLSFVLLTHRLPRPSQVQVFPYSCAASLLPTAGRPFRSPRSLPRPALPWVPCPYARVGVCGRCSWMAVGARTTIVPQLHGASSRLQTHSTDTGSMQRKTPSLLHDEEEEEEGSAWQKHRALQRCLEEVEKAAQRRRDAALWQRLWMQDTENEAQAAAVGVATAETTTTSPLASLPSPPTPPTRETRVAARFRTAVKHRRATPMFNLLDPFTCTPSLYAAQEVTLRFTHAPTTAPSPAAREGHRETVEAADSNADTTLSMPWDIQKGTDRAASLPTLSSCVSGTSSATPSHGDGRRRWPAFTFFASPARHGQQEAVDSSTRSRFPEAEAKGCPTPPLPHHHHHCEKASPEGEKKQTTTTTAEGTDKEAVAGGATWSTAETSGVEAWENEVRATEEEVERQFGGRAFFFSLLSSRGGHDSSFTDLFHPSPSPSPSLHPRRVSTSTDAPPMAGTPWSVKQEEGGFFSSIGAGGGPAHCLWHSMAQQRLQTALSTWACTLPTSTQSCLRGATIWQRPQDAVASPVLQVVLLVEQDDPFMLSQWKEEDEVEAAEEAEDEDEDGCAAQSPSLQSIPMPRPTPPHAEAMASPLGSRVGTPLPAALLSTAEQSFVAAVLRAGVSRSSGVEILVAILTRDEEAAAKPLSGRAWERLPSVGGDGRPWRCRRLQRLYPTIHRRVQVRACPTSGATAPVAAPTAPSPAFPLPEALARRPVTEEEEPITPATHENDREDDEEEEEEAIRPRAIPRRPSSSSWRAFATTASEGGPAAPQPPSHGAPQQDAFLSTFWLSCATDDPLPCVSVPLPVLPSTLYPFFWRGVSHGVGGTTWRTATRGRKAPPPNESHTCSRRGGRSETDGEGIDHGRPLSFPASFAAALPHTFSRVPFWRHPHSMEAVLSLVRTLLWDGVVEAWEERAATARPTTSFFSPKKDAHLTEAKEEESGRRDGKNGSSSHAKDTTRQTSGGGAGGDWHGGGGIWACLDSALRLPAHPLERRRKEKIGPPRGSSGERGPPSPILHPNNGHHHHCETEGHVGKRNGARQEAGGGGGGPPPLWSSPVLYYTYDTVEANLHAGWGTGEVPPSFFPTPMTTRTMAQDTPHVTTITRAEEETPSVVDACGKREGETRSGNGHRPPHLRLHEDIDGVSDGWAATAMLSEGVRGLVTALSSSYSSLGHGRSDKDEKSEAEKNTDEGVTKTVLGGEEEAERAWPPSPALFVMVLPPVATSSSLASASMVDLPRGVRSTVKAFIAHLHAPRGDGGAAASSSSSFFSHRSSEKHTPGAGSPIASVPPKSHPRKNGTLWTCRVLLLQCSSCLSFDALAATAGDLQQSFVPSSFSEKGERTTEEEAEHACVGEKGWCPGRCGIIDVDPMTSATVGYAVLDLYY